jgi:hypothetical protein
MNHFHVYMEITAGRLVPSCHYPKKLRYIVKALSNWVSEEVNGGKSSVNMGISRRRCKCRCVSIAVNSQFSVTGSRVEGRLGKVAGIEEGS